MMINFGGIVSLSTVDYPGIACTTIFLRGCHVRCKGCHNKHLWEGENRKEHTEIFKMIDPLLIGAIVISGGEPLEQIEAIKIIADYAHSLNLKVGLHTSGKGNLAEIIEYTDFILLSKPENMEWNDEHSIQEDTRHKQTKDTDENL